MIIDAEIFKPARKMPSGSTTQPTEMSGKKRKARKKRKALRRIRKRALKNIIKHGVTEKEADELREHIRDDTEIWGPFC